jgi:hypothetical protein
MNDDKPVPELVGHSGVLAARQGQPSEGALYLTLVVELHDEQFAIGSLMGAEHRPKVVRHLTRLLDTKKSASQAEE